MRFGFDWVVVDWVVVGWIGRRRVEFTNAPPAGLGHTSWLTTEGWIGALIAPARLFAVAGGDLLTAMNAP